MNNLAAFIGGSIGIIWFAFCIGYGLRLGLGL